MLTNSLIFPSLTIANQMLSLIGSLQSDPFSPAHVSKSAVTTSGVSTVEAAEEEAVIEELPQLSDGDDELDEDPFASLTQARDDAIERQQATLNVASDERSKEEKRKRKEEKRAKKDKKRSEKAEKAEKAVKFDTSDTPAMEAKPKKKRKRSEQKS